MPWTPKLSLPQAAAAALAPVTSVVRLDPTRLETSGPAPTAQSFVGILPEFSASAQEPVMAPSMPPTAVVTALSEVVTAPAMAGPVQIGGKPLSSLLAYKNIGLSANKRAMAEMKVIGVNPGEVSTPASAHEYCEPITGSRVCN